MKPSMTILICLVGILAQGCVSWQIAQHSSRYRGKVLDAVSNAPVPKAQLRLYSADLQAKTKSDSEGMFRVGPLKCFEIGFVIPPEPHLQPECNHSRSEVVFLYVTKSGYETIKVSVPRYQPFSQWPDPEGVDVGTILLKPKPQHTE
jgi:hypothetical protein